jgi:hypothetical protein
MTGPQGIFWRHVLTIAAGASVTSATAVIGTSTPAQAAKVPQKIVKCQDTPKGERRCENCVQFEVPSACKNRRLKCCRARLVHGLCEETVVKSNSRLAVSS